MTYGKLILTKPNVLVMDKPTNYMEVKAIESLQTCIVNLIRNRLDYAGWKDRKELAKALRPIQTAANEESAVAALQEFEGGVHGQRYPSVAAGWRRASHDWKQAMNQLAVLYAGRITEVPVQEGKRNRGRPAVPRFSRAAIAAHIGYNCAMDARFACSPLCYRAQCSFSGHQLKLRT
jgi:hypothetical protein